MKKIILFITFFLFYSHSYATNSSNFFASNLTIKELSQNIEKLKVENTEFQVKNKELSKEYGELISFIRSDLTNAEAEEIKENIDIYLQKRDEIEKILKDKIDKLQDTQKEKKDLILERANLYKYLAQYVSIEKRNAFIEHIKFQIQSEKESKDLIEEILKSQNILDQKVTFIKEKIESHREDLQAKIEVSITSKIRQRVDEIDNDPKYAKIDTQTKNKIYTDFINQIKARLQEIDKSKLSDNYKEMRKNILTKMIGEIKLKIK